MESTRRIGAVSRLVALLLAGLVLAPAAAADLPGSVASRVKKINTALEAVDQAIVAGRLQTAQRKLKDAQRPLQEIQKRYAGKFDENDPAYQAMLTRLAEVTGKVKAAEHEAAAADAAGLGAATAPLRALARRIFERSS